MKTMINEDNVPKWSRRILYFEHMLYTDVLVAIANGSADNPQEMCRVALESRKVRR